MIGLIFSLVSMSHAIPLQMTQQGRLLDTSGAAITGTHDLTFRIYDDQNAGSVLWSKSSPFSSTTVILRRCWGPMKSTTHWIRRRWGCFPLYMELQVDQANPLSPRTALTSAPYAQMSGVTESLVGGSVEASTIGVQNGGNPVPVIDASGNWIGPAMTVDWNNIDQQPFQRTWLMEMTTPNCLKAMWKPMSPMAHSPLLLALRFKAVESF